jgi:hypothetical protein
MARLRRRWRILKWAGVVVSIIIAIAWAVSLRWGLIHTRQTRLGVSAITGKTIGYGRIMSVSFGCVSCYWNQGLSPERGWWTIRFREPPRWLPVVYSGGAVLPLWIPFLLVAIPTTYLWWRDRRIPPGHCQKCGYNLTGNVSGICPECGERI